MIVVKCKDGSPKIDGRTCSYQTERIRDEILDFSEVNNEFNLPKKYSYTITELNGFAKIFLTKGEKNHCSKCGSINMKPEFKHRGAKIYWSEHKEIENLSDFTKNDTYYSSDSIIRECIIYKCTLCGSKKAVKTLND